ncbi:MAG: NUDIX domain-containing protein [Defluviitaleaceae bacterium]|nr:NUDIX domain-containing protein [Defluviitaleaceae bacterium]
MTNPMPINHFTATGIVFNPAGKVLMIKHKKLGVWLPPGGHVDENELPCDAVVREVFEETGVTAQVISAAPGIGVGSEAHCKELPQPLVILLEDIEKTWLHNHIDLVYLCRAGDNGVVLNAREADDIGWFTPEAVAALDTFENVRKAVAAAVKHMESRQRQ